MSKIGISMIIKEFHQNAKLEAFYDPRAPIEFLFFRNGIYSGIIRTVKPNGLLTGFGVRRSLQGTGLGKAMLHYVFEKTGLPALKLASAAHSFYHKVGGERHRMDFIIKREKLKPSQFKFNDIDQESARKYLNKQDAPLDTYPSRN